MKLTKLAIASVAFAFVISAEAAELGESVTFRSFGSVAAIHSDTDQADYYHSIGITPEGPGRTESVNWNSGSKFAGQVEWAISDRFDFTAQTLVKQYEDGDWAPRMEWAFVKFNASNELDVRVGRIRPPVYMLSDFLDVNYANPWVRPPTEQYYTVPVTNMDGIDLLWRPDFAGFSWLVQPYYGQKDLKLSGSGGDYVDIENFGLNVTASKGDFTYRAGYWEGDLGMEITQFKEADAGLDQICGLTSEPTACEHAQLLNLDDTNYRFMSLGLTWDNGDYFVQSEVGRAISNTTVLADSSSYYLTGGTRMGLWTPYVSFASFENTLPANVTESGIPTATSIALGIMQNTAQSQSTFTVGARYDILPTVSLKAQWDHTMTECGNGNAETCRGMFGRSTPAFRASEQNVNLISVAVDFIF